MRMLILRSNKKSPFEILNLTSTIAPRGHPTKPHLYIWPDIPLGNALHVGSHQFYFRKQAKIITKSLVK